ncbi:MAG TPA: hypothetical protein VNH13_07540 [Candidatus Acidoferrales bacterium]|jgi:hypothetical protein|nr:hypothetical protein [Candidatus Acidoferrales bacterium]
MKRALGVGVVAIVAATAVLVWSLVGSQSLKHADGAGPLESNGGKFADSFAWPQDVAGPVTGGVPLCLVAGSEGAIIEKIEPEGELGSGWDYLGALVRHFPSDASHSAILSAHGFPPAVPEHLYPAVGYIVTSGCTDEQRNADYTELLIGFQRPNATGGGWSGIDVTYTVSGVRHVLVIGQSFAHCGEGLDAHYCPTAPPAAQ